MQKKIAVLTGDGIGPEVVGEAVGVLKVVALRFGHEFEFEEAPVGYAAYDSDGSCLPARTLDLCRRSDAVLFGSVGDPSRDASVPAKDRPEAAALLPLRKHLNLYANLRP